MHTTSPGLRIVVKETCYVKHVDLYLKRHTLDQCEYRKEEKTQWTPVADTGLFLLLA